MLDNRYAEFLGRKAPVADATGFEPGALPDHLFDFQKSCVEFAVRQGRTGLYLDTGLGKTRCQLEWATQSAAESNGMALLLTPLAVAKQIEREGMSLGYNVRVIREQSQAKDGINICNYDRLDKLDPDAFGAVSLDEASIIKNFNGKTANALCSAFAGHRFRMCATATPAPNDHMELGQQADFLGIMSGKEMLMRWFINDTMEASQKWRLKKHAEQDFWNWLCSWSRVASRPSDITGNLLDDVSFTLPPIQLIRHRAKFSPEKLNSGEIFGAAVSATTMFDIKKQTQTERINAAIRVLESEECQTTRPAGKDMPPILNIGNGAENPTINGSGKSTQPIPNIAQKSNNTMQRNTLRSRIGSETSTGSDDTTSILQPTMQSSPSKAEDVQFAESGKTSTSIIATSPNGLGASSAIDAIGVSETSEIAQKTSATQQNTSKDWWIVWVDTNEEQDALARQLGNRAISIKGSQPTEVKEELHDAWLRGDRKILISKVSIFGFGMNWAHCHQMMFLGRTFSYESYYQAVRRCWRFGQTRPVNVHIIVAEGEDQIGRVIDRKSDDHLRMKRAMATAMQRNVGRQSAKTIKYNPTHSGELPAWL